MYLYSAFCSLLETHGQSYMILLQDWLRVSCDAFWFIWSVLDKWKRKTENLKQIVLQVTGIHIFFYTESAALNSYSDQPDGRRNSTRGLSPLLSSGHSQTDPRGNISMDHGAESVKVGLSFQTQNLSERVSSRSDSESLEGVRSRSSSAFRFKSE